MKRLNISSGSPFEPKIGFSRAVRVGPIIAVSGTAPLGPDGKTVCIGDAAGQARRCLELIAAAREKAGASMRDVVRTRVLLTRIEDGRPLPPFTESSSATSGPRRQSCRFPGSSTPTGSWRSRSMRSRPTPPRRIGLAEPNC